LIKFGVAASRQRQNPGRDHGDLSDSLFGLRLEGELDLLLRATWLSASGDHAGYDGDFSRPSLASSAS